MENTLSLDQWDWTTFSSYNETKFLSWQKKKKCVAFQKPKMLIDLKYVFPEINGSTRAGP